ncbi:MAG: hypothetical protein IKU43_11665 [Clostridia bacterium]|nr:hypothetical protein [Clostridia bacterium]
MTNDKVYIKKTLCAGFPDKRSIIYLTRGGGIREGFEVVYKNGRSNVKSGSCCICYDAVLLGDGEGGASGKLKEFYPSSDEADSFFLERKKDNSLICNPSANASSEAFRLARSEFERAYLELRGIVKRTESLRAFIPEFTLYYTCDENGMRDENGTVYVWTTSPPVETFDTYLESVRRETDREPAHKLFVILNTILNLTECIDIMHSANLMHLDIKPSNFAFMKRGNKTLYDSISLFDVNSFTPGDKIISSYMGTPGYCAPGAPTFKSDIYSIGATLFKAIIINDEIADGDYSGEYYTRIRELVKTSRLICACPENSSIFLTDKLSEILLLCLHDFEQRRPDAKRLIALLEEAILLLIPAEYSKSFTSARPEGKALSDIEKAVKKAKRRDISLLMCNHLFEHPLYEYRRRADSSEKSLSEAVSMDIVICGFGNYGQCFLDTALPLSQMYNTRVTFHIISDSMKGFEIYRRSRPALEDFFNIGEENDRSRYGSIRLKVKAYSDIDSSFTELVKSIRPCYIFVSLGDDRQSTSLAQELKSEIPECSVSYALENGARRSLCQRKGLYSFDAGGTASEGPEFATLERLAFNCHMLWNSNYNENPETVRRKFVADKYNYLSCITNAVSVKYKLAGIGITQENLTLAVAEYDSKVNAEGSEGLRSSLISCEQHRWVTDKICREGYTRLSDMEEAADIAVATGKTYDKIGKRHICIVKCTDGSTLENPDDVTPELEKGLDELDRVSLSFYRAFKRRADEIIKKDPLCSAVTGRIRELVKDNRTSLDAFEGLLRVMTLISSGKGEYVRKYDDALGAFTATISLFGKDKRQELRNLSASLNSHFSPICRSLRFINFRNQDADLVERLPFIVTSIGKTHTVSALITEKDGTVLDNIASDIFTNPVRITYLCRVQTEEDIRYISDSTDFVCAVADSCSLGSKITLSVLCSAKLFRRASELRSLCARHKRVDRVNIIRDTDESGAGAILGKIWSSRGNTTVLLRKNCLTESLFKGKLPTEIPSFAFNAYRSKFYDIRGCDFLRYTDTSRSLPVNAILRAGLADGSAFGSAAFGDYTEIYENIYAPSKSEWHGLCDIIKSHMEKSGISAAFDTAKKADIDSAVKREYIRPEFARGCLEKILSELKNAGIVTAESRISFSDTDTLSVQIYTAREHIPQLDALLSDPYRLMRESELSFGYDGKVLSVVFDSLRINGLCLGKGGISEKYGKILKALCESGLIYCLTIDADKAGTFCSFTLASPHARELLTNADCIVQRYCFSRLYTMEGLGDIAIFSDRARNSDGRLRRTIAATKGLRLLLVSFSDSEENSDTALCDEKRISKYFGKCVRLERCNGRSGLASESDFFD